MTRKQKVLFVFTVILTLTAVVIFALNMFFMGNLLSVKKAIDTEGTQGGEAIGAAAAIMVLVIMGIIFAIASLIAGIIGLSLSLTLRHFFLLNNKKTEISENPKPLKQLKFNKVMMISNIAILALTVIINGIILFTL